MVIQRTNPFLLLQENEKFFIFTKMILQVILKINCFQFWNFWEPQWWRFRLRECFRSSKCIKCVFKTSLWYHSFAPKSFGVSRMILLFLCSRKKSKVYFLCLLVRWRSQNLPICWMLLHFLTSRAPKKFSMS